MGVYRPMTPSGCQCAAREDKFPALLNIGSMSPTRLPLGMVASRQSPLPFHPIR